MTTKAPIRGWVRNTVAAVLLLGVYLAAIVAFNVGSPLYRRFSSASSSYVRYEKAEVLKIEEESLTKDPLTGLEVGVQVVDLKILTGEHRNEIAKVRNALSYSGNVKATEGARVIVCVDTADRSNHDVWIYSYDRGPFLYVFVGLFVLALCAIGGTRGIRSTLGILFTFTGIVFLFIPMLYRGYSPALAAIGVVVSTICVSMVLLGGVSAKTLSAILGSLAGVLVSILCLYAALGATHLSALNTGEADALIQIAGFTSMRVGELLFAGILISSVGAVMDIAISISSAVNEVYLTNPGLQRADLFRSGMNVGRDMMGTMANTLIVAFTGTSLNMLVLLYSMSVTYYQVVNNNLIAIYIVQTVSGSIAVVLAVPLVSMVAAYLVPAAGRLTRASSGSEELARGSVGLTR